MTPPSTPKEKFQWVFLFERVNLDFFVMVKANGKKLVERNWFINIKRNGAAARAIVREGAVYSIGISFIGLSCDPRFYITMIKDDSYNLGNETESIEDAIEVLKDLSDDKG